MSIRNVLRWTIKGSVIPHVDHLNAWRLAEFNNLLRFVGLKILSMEYMTWERNHRKDFLAFFLPRIFHRNISMVIA